MSVRIRTEYKDGEFLVHHEYVGGGYVDFRRTFRKTGKTYQRWWGGYWEEVQPFHLPASVIITFALEGRKECQD